MGISLVLGGGAVRGFYHVGVLRALQEQQVQIADISGCSIGAIIGAFYAAEPERDLDVLIDELKLMDVMNVQFRRGSLLGVRKIKTYLEQHIPATFEELQIPLRVNATDINTGEEKVFFSGELVPAVLASMSLPGVFPLTEYDGTLYCDGGLCNNVPIHLAQTDSILAVDINMPLKEITSRTRQPDVLFNTALIPMHRSLRYQNELAELQGKKVLSLSLTRRVSPVDIRKSTVARLISEGYQDAKQEINSL